MRFPGFTAEASLFKTAEPYRLVRARADGSGGQAVIPQQWDICWRLIGVNACVCCKFSGPPYCRYVSPCPPGY